MNKSTLPGELTFAKQAIKPEIAKTKILIAEHDVYDIELLNRELQKSSINYIAEVVQNEEAYTNTLQSFAPDIILSDYSFPSFNGLAAFKIKENIAPDIPFIIVSGTLDEERSIELIRSGITDYVLKDKLFTLTEKVKRAIREANEKQERKRTELQLVQSSKLLLRSQQLAKLGSWDLKFADNVFVLSPEGATIFGLAGDNTRLSFEDWLLMIHPEDKNNTLQIIAETRESLKDTFYDYRILLKDGTTRHLYSESKAEFDAGGNATGFYGIIQDVTERKKNESILEKAYEEKNMVLERIDDGFFAIDKDSTVTYWNKRAEVLLNITKQEIIGKNLHTVFAPTGSAAFYDNYEKALKENITVHFEEFSNRAKRWFAVSAFGSDNGLSVYFKDVTERRNSEDKLKDSELRYRSIIDQATDAICIADPAMKILDINIFGCQLLGYSKEEFIHLSISDLFLREDLIANPFKISELKSGRIIRNERRFKRKDGTLVEVELSARILEDGRFLVFGHDIAERKKADNKIKESELRYRSLNEQATDAICITDGSLKFIDINPYACEMFGYSKEEALQLSLPDIIFPEDLVANPLKTNELKLGNTIRNERRLKRKNGTAVHMEVSTKIMEDGTLIMFGHDITERKKNELRVIESEKKYRQIVETAHEGIWLIDENNDTTFVNKKMAQILEYAPVEMIGKRNYFFMDEEWKMKAAGYLANRKRGVSEVYDFKFITRSGKEVWTNLSTNALFDDTGSYKGALAMVTDITARKKTEQEISWLINNTEESFILLNRDLEITSFNERAQKLYSELLLKKLVKGSSILEYVQPDRYNKVKEIYEKVLEGSEEIAEIVIPVKGSAVKNFALKYKPAKDEQGNIIGIFVSAIDITEKKKAEVQKEFERRDKEALINTTTDLIWSVSSDFKLIAANKAFINSLKRFNGLELHPGDKMLMKDKFPPEYVSYWKNLYTKALSGKAHIEEVHFPANENQAEFWGEINFNPIYDGDTVTGIACYSRNTTASVNFKNKLIDINKKLENAQQIAGLGYWELNMDLETLYWSDEVYRIWGVTKDNFTVSFTSFHETIHPGDKERFDAVQKNALRNGDKMDIEYRIITHTGQIKCVHEIGELVYNNHGQALRFEGTVQDITERKELEKLLNKATKLARIGSWEVDLQKDTLYWSEMTKEIHEADAGYIPSLEPAINFYKEGESRDLITKIMKDSIEKGDPWDVELEIITTKGNEKWIRSIGEAEFANGKVIRINGSFQDIDVRKRAELELIKVFEEKNTILESIDDAFFAVDFNWIVTYWNSHAEKVLKKTKAETLHHNLWDIFSKSIDSASYLQYHKAMETRQSVHFEDFYPVLSTWYEISAYPSPNGLSVYFKDVSERKHSEMRLNELNESLLKQAKELEVSNAELEQFAYVASHDLQEPLRMVTSFLNQLEKKYGNIIDEKGKKYIGFAVNGAKRMRQIILDLLDFSRVGRTEEKQEDIDLNEIVTEIQMLLRKQIEEKKALITVDKLPCLHNHRSPVQQVFQNLIGNALKYSRKDVPCRIHICGKESGEEWEFSVADNGVGIAEEYYEKIFIIFQRLHNKDEYSGTGMGLAVTKKIIENQGGKIWVRSEEGKGATFYFTMKK